MSYNGSGDYSLPAGQPVVTGTTISSTTHNNLANDLATAFDTAFCRDGQAAATALFNMGGFRIQNMGAATGVAHAVIASQVQNNSLTLLSSVAGTDTITGTATPTPAAYASGQKFILIPANTNTAATTLNVSSLGAKSVFWNGAACIGGELQQNVPTEVVYDGTQFNILTNSSAWTTGDVKVTLKTAADAGWVLMNDGTIGDASSGATRANADTEALFTMLWNNTADAQCAVSTGRGANAAADFAAHKTIALPRALGRALAVYGAGSGLTSRALALANGSEDAINVAHTHTYESSNGTNAQAGGSGGDFLTLAGFGTGKNTSSTGASGTGANMQPTLFLNVMIKL